MRPAARCARWLAVCGLLSSVVAAGPLPDRFTLGRYIPGDVWLYIHTAQNPERAWLDAEWADVFAALKDSGIHRDIISTITSMMGADDRAKVDDLLAALENVRWADLALKEIAIGERVARGLPPGMPRMPYDYFILMRGTPDDAAANMTALVGALKLIASWSDQIRLAEHNLGGVVVWWLGPNRFDSKSPSFRAYVFHKQDVIGVAFGSPAAKDILDLVAGTGKKPPIVGLPLFQEALAQLPPPEDTVMFFNAGSLFAGIDALMESVLVEARADPDPKGFRLVTGIKKMLDRCNVFEYSIVTVNTDGPRERTHSAARIRRDQQQSTLVSAVLGRRPFDRFDQYIPVDATGFSLDTLIDLEQLYKLVIDFIEHDVPDGAEYVGWWNQLLATFGFDPQRDLFSWWSGEMVSVSLPTGSPGAFGGADFVIMFRVKDAELASRKIGALLDALCCKFQLGGQAFIVADAPVSAGGFRQITHPLFMMLARPVIGVKDEWLMVGSSPKAVDRCLAVAAGQAPSIIENERFKREGLTPGGPVAGMSFKDMSRFGEESGVLVHLLGMLAAGYAEALPDHPETRDIKTVLRALTGTIMKLGPVLQRIDFYSSRSRITTFDGALTLRTESVTTFKPPPAGDVKAADSAK